MFKLVCFILICNKYLNLWHADMKNIVLGFPHKYILLYIYFFLQYVVCTLCTVYDITQYIGGKNLHFYIYIDYN